MSMPTKAYPALPSFLQVGRLPESGDNAAVVINEIRAGEGCTDPFDARKCIRFSHDILEGHRFAVKPILKGTPLLSWGLPFGWALSDIQAGDYVCNDKILNVLRQRAPHLILPPSPNFIDHYKPFELQDYDPNSKAVPLALIESNARFLGFDRGILRGVGTRNCIVVLGVSSRAASFVRALADKFQAESEGLRSRDFDGIVAVAHTEGGLDRRSNNHDLVLKTLAGMMVHPNVGAVLAVDYGNEDVHAAALAAYMKKWNYPLDSVPHDFVSIQSGFSKAHLMASKILTAWLREIPFQKRSKQPLSKLKIALQCGGSDAFSGLSGNPLAGCMAKRIIQAGGSANLAETDELMGAESYMLKNVKDRATANLFLEKIRRFEQWASWHGHSGASNPSGGNNYRGLYNIAIKSIGAARKKDPEVCLDHVIDYSDPMREPGFYFMDSPGNDLESLAGQVASGCNMILFITGNGSITNFPFVPTLKIVTTSKRFELLKAEMDINAGLYQDGMPMEELCDQAMDLMRNVASGDLTAGEKAGHYQAQIWRDWRQTSSRLPDTDKKTDWIPKKRDPIRIAFGKEESPCLELMKRIGRIQIPPTAKLIMPTSLCSGQVGHLIANHLNREKKTEALPWICLSHTEGCGSSDQELERMQLRMMAAYLVHPLVQRCILLEHGCEKTHNDAVRSFLQEHGIPADQFGWASIQKDGGIAKVAQKVEEWDLQWNKQNLHPHPPGILIGLIVETEMDPWMISLTLELIRSVVQTSGSLVLTQQDPVCREIQDKYQVDCTPNLPYGSVVESQGLHIMETPTEHRVEKISGMAACGCSRIILFKKSGECLQGNPLVPTFSVRVTDEIEGETEDSDLVLNPMRLDPKMACGRVLEICLDTSLNPKKPVSQLGGNTDFQITRGHWGISL